MKPFSRLKESCAVLNAELNEKQLTKYVYLKRLWLPTLTLEIKKAIKALFYISVFKRSARAVVFTLLSFFRLFTVRYRQVNS
jgi:hypothetical protein